MKKTVLFLFVSLLTLSLFSQSVKTEYIYLTLVNRQQNIKLIENNLRNAEIIADSLFFRTENGVKENDSLASLFFKELAVSYYISGNYPMAMFTFLRQRYLYPDPKMDKLAVYYFGQAAAFKNISKEMVTFQLEKSNPETIETVSVKEREYALLNNSILLNQKELNQVILHYADMVKETRYEVPEFVNQWAFLVTIGIPQKLMRGYVNYYQGEIDTLNFKFSKILYRKAAHYYLKNNAWETASVYIEKYDRLPLKINNRITSGWFKFRRNLHF